MFCNQCFQFRYLYRPTESQFHASTVLQSKSVVLSLKSFSIKQLNGPMINRVNILSALDNKLLVSYLQMQQLLIYNSNGSYLSEVAIEESDLHDAVWTPDGKILYATYPSSKLVIITETNKLVAKSALVNYGLLTLSVSSDKMIYIFSQHGIFQSVDNAITWTQIYGVNTQRMYVHGVKASSNYSEDLWIVELKNMQDLNLSVRSMNKKHKDFYVSMTLKDIFANTKDQNYIELSVSSLSFDGTSKIFLSDFTNCVVHEFSLNGQYIRQLLSSDHIMRPSKLTVDISYRWLYIGQENNVVSIFKL